MRNFSIRTKKTKEVVDITQNVASLIDKEKSKNGVVNLFLAHTSAAITTADLDPGTEGDYLKAVEALKPDAKFNHPHDPSHFSDHFFSSAIGTGITIPVENGKLLLGTWQRIVLIELNGPKERNIIATFLRE